MWTIAAMSSPRSLAVSVPLALAVAACGGKRDDASAGQPGAPAGKAPAPAHPAAAADPFTPRDVSGAALAKVDDAIGAVGFSIDLPSGLVREAKDAYVTWSWPDGMFNAPSITVQLIDVPPASLEAAVAAAKLTSDPELVVATQEAVPGGFLVSVHRPDDRFLSTDLSRGVADGKALRCSVTARTGDKQGPIPARAATMKLAETICRSLTPR